MNFSQHRKSDIPRRSIQKDPKLAEKIRADIRKLKPHCHWTEPTWESLGGMRAKDIQNTPSSVNLLANLLVRAYAGIGDE